MFPAIIKNNTITPRGEGFEGVKRDKIAVGEWSKYVDMNINETFYRIPEKDYITLLDYLNADPQHRTIEIEKTQSQKINVRKALQYFTISIVIGFCIFRPDLVFMIASAVFFVGLGAAALAQYKPQAAPEIENQEDQEKDLDVTDLSAKDRHKWLTAQAMMRQVTQKN